MLQPQNNLCPAFIIDVLISIIMLKAILSLFIMDIIGISCIIL